MPVSPVTTEALRAIARNVGELMGWDFSAVCDDRDPVPWDSFVFFLKAVPLPEQFDPDVHCAAVNRAISACGTPRGIQTNEHRHLLIAEKPAA